MSVPQSPHRQSGTKARASQVSTPRAPPRCAIAVSDVISKSTEFKIAAESTKAPSVSISFPRDRTGHWFPMTGGRGSLWPLPAASLSIECQGARRWVRRRPVGSSDWYRPGNRDCPASRLRPEDYCQREGVRATRQLRVPQLQDRRLWRGKRG